MIIIIIRRNELHVTRGTHQSGVGGVDATVFKGDKLQIVLYAPLNRHFVLRALEYCQIVVG